VTSLLTPPGAGPLLADGDAAGPVPRRAATRRVLGGAQKEDFRALVGAGIAASTLTYLIYFVLLPWTGLLGFVVVGFAVFLCLYGLLVSQTAPAIHVQDKIAAVVMHSLAFAMLLALGDESSPADKPLHLNFFTSDLSGAGPLDPLTEGGVLHAMAGTLMMITIALLVTVPLGLVTAVYLSENRSRFARFVRTIAEAMTALPSVIAGLFVYALILTLQDAIGIGEKSGLAASGALAVMMLPIVIRAADVVLRLVPGTLKEAASALGAPRWRVVWHVVMPTSRSGLMTAVILGTARGIGETSPVLLTAGYTTAVNLDPTSGPMVSLPLATFILTRSPEPTQIARGFGAAAVLMLIVLVLFVIARVLGGRGAGELSARQRRRAATRSAQDVGRYDAYDAASLRIDTAHSAWHTSNRSDEQTT